MVGYRPYPQYKDSGVEWLGEVPGHWEIKKLKFVAVVQPSNVDKKSEVDEESVLLCNYTDVYKNEFIDSSLEFMKATATKTELDKFSVDVGDVIVTKDSESRDDIAVPACVVEKVNGLVCGYHLTQIKGIKIEGKYLFRLFQSSRFGAQFVVAANGITRFGLPQYAISNAFISIPPEDEQKTIARFLDHKIALIDALIAKKQTLLEKLAEKRIALISHAVTKGLDPNVKMKGSGVEWLGQVPEYWDVSRLSLIATSLQTGPFGSQLHAGDYIEGGAPLINPADIVDGKLVANPKNTVSADVVERLSRHVLELGDIVIARRGEMGRAGIVTNENVGWLCGTGSLRARMDKNKIIPEYLLQQFSLHGIADYLSLQSVGSTMDNLNTSILGRVPVLLPSLEEQRDILLALGEVENKVKVQAGKVGTAIRKLKEYRSALITHAVTGKIDVCNVKLQEATIKAIVKEQAA